MGLPKGVQATKGRNGRVYYYWRATQTRLPDDPDSPEFARAIAAARAGEVPKSGTMGALLREYRMSAEYRDLAPSTRYTYERAMELLRPFDEVPVADFRRRTVLKIRDGLIGRPARANQFTAFCSLLFAFAVDREYRDHNPASAIRLQRKTPYKAWSDDQIEVMVTRFPPQLARAGLVALYTGQREGDCLAMTWADYDGSAIRVQQQKTHRRTGETLWIAAHRDLRDMLDSWRADAASTHILTNARGLPWKSDSFKQLFSREVQKVDGEGRAVYPELAGLVFHGLRKTAAKKLAEAGCSVHEIAAITGHRSLQMVEHYTREAEQRTRATAAILKLEKAGENIRKKGRNRL